MTGFIFYSTDRSQNEFIGSPEIYKFLEMQLEKASAVICGKNIHSILASSETRANILDADSDDAKELIEKSDRYDETVVLGDDVLRFAPHIDKLYFFADSNENLIEEWDNFCRDNNFGDDFIHSEYGCIDRKNKKYPYIYLERTSSGNRILYNELTRMIKQHKLTELALSGAAENVKSYITDNFKEAEAEGFVPLEAMQYCVHSCRYCIDSFSADAEDKCERISVDIEMKNPHKIIGYYTMTFDSGNGIITDDVFYSPF